MKKHILLTLIIFVLALKMYAQNGFISHIKTGYAFNSKIELNNQAVRKSRGYTIDFGGSYKIIVFKKWYSEFGLAGRTIFSSGEIDEISFNATTLRALMIGNVGFQISNQWEIYTGVVFQNNNDFTKIDFRVKYFWRLNHITGTRYAIAPKWYLTSSWSFDLRNLPDPFLINDPKFLFQIGVERQL